MLRKNSRVAVILLAGGVAGAAAALRTPEAATGMEQERLTVENLAPPTGPGASQPRLSVDSRGAVYLIWTERPQGVPPSIRFAVYSGGGWSEARTVYSGRGIVASAADLPSLIVLPSGRLVAHWQQAATTGARSYGVRISQSSDAGRSWSEPIIPHRSHEIGENGFVSLFAHRGDSVGVIWLDGRAFTGAGARDAATALMVVHMAADGGMSAEQRLDDRVCDCCHTSFTSTPSGPIVAYRDRSGDEIRDIAFISRVNNSWSAPRTVSSDGWNIRSCPVNGPSIGSYGDALAVGWFSAARDSARVQVAFAASGTTGFSRPVRLDIGDPLGRVALAMTEPNSAWVSWLERVPGSSAQLRVRRATSSGSLSPAYSLADPNLTHTTGFPQMVSSGGYLYLAWTTAAETGAPPAVRIVRVRTPA